MKRSGKLAVAWLSALVWAAMAAALQKAPDHPVWPAAYEMQYTLTLPYLSSLQPGGLQIPTHVWYDSKARAVRVSVYNGLDDIYVLPGVTYNVFPRISVRTCAAFNTTVGPTLGAGGALTNEGALPPPLPDISSWTYAGTGRLSGKPPTYIWQYTERWWDKVNTYTFHTAQANGAPVLLQMLGVNVFSGSHYDQYNADFTYWAPLYAPLVLRPPKVCASVAPDPSQAHGGLTTQVLSLLPSHLTPGLGSSPKAGATSGPFSSPSSSSLGWWGDVKVALQGLAHRLSHALTLPAAIRTSTTAQAAASDSNRPTDAVTAANLAYIEAFNRQQDVRYGAASNAASQQAAGRKVGAADGQANGPSFVRDGFKLGVGKWVSWSDEDWRAVALGRHAGPSPGSTSPTPGSLSNPEATAAATGVSSRHPRSKAHLGTYARVLRDDELPEAVDWRGTGADGAVKDQASCGSCWAFAASGAMSGAWFLATGEALSFSEQQIVDCAWDHGVHGCSGGWMEPALDYISKAGGGAQEGAYPYLGANGFCKENTTAKAGFFKGYKTVAPGDEKALMEVVALHGPVAISFDAVHPTFKYYSEGVYYRSDCGHDEDHLNHAVVLVGYGTTPSGTDYWLLRNSWSLYWGDSGYFKLARKGNDCGVTVDPVLAIVDDRAAGKRLSGEGRAAVAAARARAVRPPGRTYAAAAATTSVASS